MSPANSSSNSRLNSLIFSRFITYLFPFHVFDRRRWWFYSTPSYFRVHLLDAALALVEYTQYDLAAYLWCDEHAVGVAFGHSDGPLLLDSSLVRGNHLLELDCTGFAFIALHVLNDAPQRPGVMLVMAMLMSSFKSRTYSSNISVRCRPLATLLIFSLSFATMECFSSTDI